MRVRALTVLVALAMLSSYASAQSTYDEWKATPSQTLTDGVRAELSVTVAANGDKGGGKVTLSCTVEDGASLTISSTKPIGRDPKPWRKVRIRFDKAPFFDKDWRHTAQTSTVSIPEYVSYFIRYGKLAASLYVNVTGPDDRKVDLPEFPMYGFTDALKTFPADCLP